MVIEPCSEGCQVDDPVVERRDAGLPSGTLPSRADRSRLVEVREETGVDVQIITGPVPAYDPVVTHPVPFTIIEAPAADPANGWHQHIDALFVCYAPTGRIGRLDNREATGARWTELDEMRKLKVPGELPAITKATISWAAQHGNRTSAS